MRLFEALEGCQGDPAALVLKLATVRGPWALIYWEVRRASRACVQSWACLIANRFFRGRRG